MVGKAFFEEAEMHEVIRGFNGDKSPGPDCSPVIFFSILLGYS